MRTRLWEGQQVESTWTRYRAFFGPTLSSICAFWYVLIIGNLSQCWKLRVIRAVSSQILWQDINIGMMNPQLNLQLNFKLFKEIIFKMAYFSA